MKESISDLEDKIVNLLDQNSKKGNHSKKKKTKKESISREGPQEGEERERVKKCISGNYD